MVTVSALVTGLGMAIADGAEADNVTSPEPVNHSATEPNTAVAGNDAVLHRAIRGGNIERLQSLLDSGADPNGLDDSGVPPAFVALRHDDTQALELLLAAGADPDYVNETAGARVKVYSASGRWKNIAESPLNCSALPLEDGLFQFHENLSLLEMAISNARVTQVVALIDAGVNLGWTDCYGNTALRTAVMLARFEIALTLLEAGANPNITNRWGMPLAETAKSRGIGDPVWKKKFLEALEAGSDYSGDVANQ